MLERRVQVLRARRFLAGVGIIASVRVPFYLVDAFAEQAFCGNPAAVCVLDTPGESAWMQSVAAEMKQSETAFLHKTDYGYSLRWFTPTVEVDLCGHATLASAHILWETGLLSTSEQAVFSTRSGLLYARRSSQDETIRLDLPIDIPTPCSPPDAIRLGLGMEPIETYKCKLGWLALLGSAETVRTLKPDFDAIAVLGDVGVIITAESGQPEFDFVSRFFAPQAGIPEDPVTGAAHCVLAPFWSTRLGKIKLRGYQASARGGIVGVEIGGHRVSISGKAVTVIRGELLASSRLGVAAG